MSGTPSGLGGIGGRVRRSAPVQEDGSAGPESIAALTTAQDGLSRELRALRAALDARIRAVVVEAERRERSRGVLLIGLSVAAIAVGLLATAISARSLRPVRTLIAGVGRIRRGDYTARLNLPGDDEIFQLGREFDAMSGALEEREQALAPAAAGAPARRAARGGGPRLGAGGARGPETLSLASDSTWRCSRTRSARARSPRPARPRRSRRCSSPSPARWTGSPRPPSATCAWRAPLPRRSPPRT